MVYTGDSTAPLREIKNIQFGVWGPDEIVSQFSLLIGLLVGSFVREFVSFFMYSLTLFVFLFGTDVLMQKLKISLFHAM